MPSVTKYKLNSKVAFFLSEVLEDVPKIYTN